GHPDRCPYGEIRHWQSCVHVVLAQHEADPPNYVGFRRDAVELHMQFQFEYEMGTIRLRFLVEDPDTLFNEYRQRGVECLSNSVDNTLWGTREFALYDLDRNALTFYRDLTPAEKGRQGS